MTSGNLSFPCQETNPSIHESSARTYLEVSVFRHTWTINDFSLIYEDMTKNQKKISSSFPVNDNLMCTLSIMYYREKTDGYIPSIYSVDRGYIEITIDISGDRTELKEAKHKVYILTSEKKESHVWEKSNCYTYKISHEFVTKDSLFDTATGLLPDGNLTIVCELSLCKYKYSSTISGPLITEVPECKYCSDLNELYEESKFTDAVVSASGKEFKVHKFILAKRSSVFAAMFEHPMEEKETGRVEINDIKPSVMEEVLRFIYTGKVKNLDNIAEDLLAPADKYDLNRLKIMCEEVLSQKLSVANAANILVLADLHACSDLKTKVIRFIANHATEIQNADGWNSFVTSHPHLLAEAFMALAKI